MKKLKEIEYKGYTVVIKGVFESGYGVKYQDKWHKGAVFIIIDIYKNNLHVKSIKWSNYLTDDGFHQEELVAKNRLLYNGFFNNKVTFVTIQEDMLRVMMLSETKAKNYIDDMMKNIEKQEYDKMITDGLPDSLNLLEPQY